MGWFLKNMEAVCERDYDWLACWFDKVVTAEICCQQVDQSSDRLGQTLSNVLVPKGVRGRENCGLGLAKAICVDPYPMLLRSCLNTFDSSVGLKNILELFWSERLWVLKSSVKHFCT